MKEKEKLIRYFEASGIGEDARRIIDMAEQVAKSRPYRISDFVSPALIQVAEAVKANFGGIDIKINGGYERAERIRIALFSNQYQGNIDFEIVAIKVKWDPRFRLLTHRDVLGALLGLGIERHQVGDILMQVGGAQIIVTENMKTFILDNFKKIAMVGVECEEVSLAEIIPKEERVKEIRTTVASMRLDAVASSGFSLSRTKLVEAISAGLLQINWKSVKGPSQEVKAGDVISMRGRGRVVVEEITGMSRKGRTGIFLKRFM